MLASDLEDLNKALKDTSALPNKTKVVNQFQEALPWAWKDFIFLPVTAVVSVSALVGTTRMWWALGRVFVHVVVPIRSLVIAAWRAEKRTPKWVIWLFVREGLLGIGIELWWAVKIWWGGEEVRRCREEALAEARWASRPNGRELGVGVSETELTFRAWLREMMCN